MKRALAIFMAFAMMTSLMPATVFAEDIVQMDAKDGDKNSKNAYMKLDIPELQILAGGTVSYDTFGVDTVYRDFELGEIVTLTISEGFEFVPSDIHDHDGTVLQNVVWSADGKKVEVPVYKEYDTGFDMEAMTIKATTAKVGDEALLTVSAENYPDVSQVIAIVVDQITQQDDCSISVDRIVEIEEEGTATLEDVVLEADGTDFTTGETLMLTISAGFAFVANANMDTNQADIVSFTDSELVLKPNQTTDEIIIEDMKIKAVAATVGKTAKLSVSGDMRMGETAKVARVIRKPAFKLELKGEVELPVGHTTEMECLFVTKTDGVFQEGEEITLSVGKYISFGEVYYETIKLPINGGENQITITIPKELAGRDMVEITKWEIRVSDSAKVGQDVEVTVEIGDDSEEITVGTVVDYSLSGKFSKVDITEKDLAVVEDYGAITQIPAPGIVLEIGGVDYSYVDAAVTPVAELEIHLVNANLENFDLDEDGILDAAEKQTLQSLIMINNPNVTVELDSVDDWDSMTFVITGKLEDGDEISVELPANFYKGTEAMVSVRGDITEGKCCFAVLQKDVMTLATVKKNIAKYGSVFLSNIVINCGTEEFAEGEIIHLDLNEFNGFTFDDTREKEVAATNASLKKLTDERINLIVTADTNQVEVEGIVVFSDDTVKIGDQAILTVSYEGFKDVNTVVAEVVQDRLVLDVEAQTVKNDGKAVYDVFGIDKTAGGRFKEADEVTLTLNDGFAFVKGDIRDGDGTVLKVKEWGENRIVVLAPADPNHGFDMEGLTISAASAKPGEVATVTASVDGYEDVSKDILTVIKSSSGGSSSKKDTSTTNTAEAPKVTVAETTTESGETTTVDKTAQTLETVPQAEKEAYQEQLSQTNPAMEVVGSGAYTFAIAAETKADTEVDTDSTSSNGVKDPEKVFFVLDGQNLEDTSHLTLVKYVTQPDGTVEVVKLGGAFDPATNTFAAYADGEGVYDLVYDPDVTKITFAIGQTEVSINDAVQNNDVAPVLYENKTMVPLRSIAEALGAVVVWDEATKTVHMVLGDQVLSLAVDADESMTMIMNDRILVQLRYIGETFGARVRWIPSTQSIEIVK